MSSPLLLAFAGAAGAAMATLVTGLFMRRKTSADATDVITQAAERVVTQLSKALDQAQETAERLAAEVDELKREIGRLRALVVSLGGDPRQKEHRQ